MARPRKPIDWAYRTEEGRDRDEVWVKFWIGDTYMRKPTGVRNPCGPGGTRPEVPEAARKRGLEIILEESTKAGVAVDAALAVEKPDLKTLFDRFAIEMENVQRRKKRNPTYASVISSDIRIHIQPRWKLIEELTPPAWKKAMDEMHDKGTLQPAADGKKAVYSGALRWRSIARIGVSLNHFIDYCVAAGALPFSPKLEMPEKESIDLEQSENPRRPMSREDRDEFLGYILKHGHVAAHRHYSCMFFNWFRKSTVERMTRRWINLDTGIIKIPAYRYKGRQTIELYLHARSLQAIKDQLADNEKESGTVQMDAPIFGPFDHKTLFESAIAKLKIDDAGLTAHHVARHTGATIAGDAGHSDTVLMAQMGVQSPAVVRRYVHHSAETGRKALEPVTMRSFTRESETEG